MQNINDILKGLNSQFFMRDLLYVSLGILLLFASYLLLPSLHNKLTVISGLSNFEQDVLVVLVAYFFARFCNEVGFVLTTLVLIIFKKDKLKSLGQYSKKIFGFINENELVINTKGSTIDEIEVDKYLLLNLHLNNVVERHIISLMIERILLGYSIIMSYYYSPKVLIVVTFLFLVSINSHIGLNELRTDVARLMEKDSEKVSK